MVDPVPSNNPPQPEPDNGGNSEFFDLGPDLSPEFLHRTALAIGMAKHLMTQVSVDDWLVFPEEPRKIIIEAAPLFISLDYSANHSDPVIQIRAPECDIEIAPGNPWIQELPALAALLCKEHQIQSAKKAIDTLDIDCKDLREQEGSFRIQKTMVCRKFADGYTHSEVTEQAVHIEKGDGVVSFVDEDSINFRKVSKLEYGTRYRKEKVNLFNQSAMPLIQEKPEKALRDLDAQAREAVTRKFCSEVPESLGPRKTNLIYSNPRLEGLMSMLGAVPIKLRYEIPSEALVEAINRMKHWSVNIVSRGFLYIDETASKT